MLTQEEGKAWDAARDAREALEKTEVEYVELEKKLDDALARGCELEAEVAARDARIERLIEGVTRFLDRQGYDRHYCETHGIDIWHQIEAAGRGGDGGNR